MARIGNLTDGELVDLLIQGNHEAYTEIYNRYSRVLYIHAYNKLCDRDEVKDIIQELFTTIWLRRAELSSEKNLRGYLYQAIQNRVLKVYAHKKIRAGYIESFQKVNEAGSQITDHLIREKQLAAIIEKEVSVLPEKMRIVFMMSRRDHLSHKAIAERLGITEATVKTHVNHALKILKTKLTIITFLFLLLR